MEISAERDLVSIGNLATHLQAPVRAIERAAAEAGVTPALRINGIAHFNAVQMELIRLQLQERQR